jgi:hypothetical protein
VGDPQTLIRWAVGGGVFVLAALALRWFIRWSASAGERKLQQRLRAFLSEPRGE